MRRVRARRTSAAPRRTELVQRYVELGLPADDAHLAQRYSVEPRHIVAGAGDHGLAAALAEPGKQVGRQLDLRADTAPERRLGQRDRNLVGQRYLALSDEIGNGTTLRPGATIAISQTTPALDLTVLFNGFKPLFEALSPNDINALSYEIVQVFQGEGGTLEGLLASTASVTQTLADRDQVINDLVDNLNEVLAHVGERDEELTRLIKSFRTFVGGLKDDRKAILGSLQQISALSSETAGLVSGIRKPFVRDIKDLRRFAALMEPRAGN